MIEQINTDQYAADGLAAGCPAGQMENFIRAGIILQPRQPAASAAARLCDQPAGPTAIGYGGARGGGKPSLFIHQRCTRLLDCLPFLQHDPDQPADVLKTNTNEEGVGGDDAADALRYMVATESRKLYQRKLTGW